MSAAASGLSKPAARFSAEFYGFVQAESARWVRPAAATLAREGVRAAAVYRESGSEFAALESVDAEDWRKYLGRVWITTAPRAAHMVEDQFTAAKALDDPFIAATIRWLREFAGGRIQGITDTSRDEIGNQIRIGVSKGETRDEIAARIVKHRRSITPERAQTIARTEVHGAANFGSLTAAREVKVPMDKVWVARAGARPEHAAASGKRVALADVFRLGGYRMQYPGDSSFGAPAQLIVNCRCVLSYEIRRAPSGRRRVAA